MKLKTLIFTLLIFLLSVNFAFSQSRKTEKANKYYEAGEYLEALEWYDKAYSKAKTKSEKAEISFKAGNSCRYLFDVNGSRKWYQRAIMNRYQDPLVHLYMAETLKMVEEYEDAKEEFANYKDLVPDDPRGEAGIKSCDLAMEWIEAEITKYGLVEIRFFNSKQNDFAPAYAKDSTELYFTSTREGTVGDTKNKNSGENFADIFYIQKDKKGKWSEAVPAEGLVNTEFDEGSCTLTPDGMTMYFTSCQIIEGKSMGCKIYKSEKSDNKWGEPEMLKIFTDSAISVGQPHITNDEKTLYFVTDHKERNVGGKDIWKMQRKSRTAQWGAPEPLGAEINTKSNELFPATDAKGNLYFSSDGHLGMGGLDIFKATPKDGGKWEIENMKPPINSSKNDFAIVFNREKENGYFSTSRTFGMGDNIMYFYKRPLKIKLKGYVQNKKNNAYLFDTKVELTGSNGEKLEAITKDDGSFEFNLSENTDYVVIATKENFLKGKGNETTKGIEENTTLNMMIKLEPSVGDIKIPNIEYALGDTTLREESKVALQGLIALLEFNPITIELKAHTDYRGSDESNRVLSQGRANSVVAFLIENGVAKERLVPKGYGESKPVVVDEDMAKAYPFLKEGDVLNKKFIDALPSKEEQEICHQLNRRTEFSVLSADWGDNYTPFGEE